MQCDYEIVLITDMFIILVDLDVGGRSVTNDAVVFQISKH